MLNLRAARGQSLRGLTALAVLALVILASGCDRVGADDPVTYTGNELKTIYFWVEEPGKYQITSQSITSGLANFKLVQPSTTECPGTFTVGAKEKKVCLAKVESKSYSPGLRGTLTTWWMPSGAKYSRRMDVRLRMN